MILPKCLFEATYFDEFEIQYRERSLKLKTFPSCAHAHASFNLLSDDRASHGWSDREDKVVGFKICKDLNVILYSQITLTH